MGTGALRWNLTEWWGVTCHRLASHFGGSYTPSCFMLKKPELSVGPSSKLCICLQYEHGIL